MRIKVISTENTPANCDRRILIEPDYSPHDSVRRSCDHTFRLWSAVRRFESDAVYDNVLHKYTDVPSPLVPVLDDDGYETGAYRIKPGIIAFSVDLYEHGGRVFSLSGESGWSCPWDTTHEACWLYTDEDRWNELGGNSPWELIDGKPSEQLMSEARKIAIEEIHELNLDEAGSYYKCAEEIRGERNAHSWYSDWIEYGCLTEDPVRDLSVPTGVPIVSSDPYVIGTELDQECYALFDKSSGKFVRILEFPVFRLECNVHDASIMPEYSITYLQERLRSAGRLLDTEIRNVTEEIWSRWPECIVHDANKRNEGELNHEQD